MPRTVSQLSNDVRLRASRGSLCEGVRLSLDQPAEDAEDGVNGARDVVGVGEESVDESVDFHGSTPCTSEVRMQR